MTPKILCIDGLNFLHRARAGIQLGPAPVMFNFARNLRAMIERFTPTRVYFVLEGHPQQRIDLLPEYKANRVTVEGTPEHEVSRKFKKQLPEIIEMVKNHFPVSTIYHPRYECDDTIYNLLKRSSRAVQWTVASNDSDFTQLLNEFDNVDLWNPMQKTYVEKPDYDYVFWKALRGDGSDNIPGIPGIGDKRAFDIVNDPDELRQLYSDQTAAQIFQRNVELIKFIEWTDDDAIDMISSHPTKDWDKVKSTFEKYGFNSITNEKSWNKFVSTFDTLW